MTAGEVLGEHENGAVQDDNRGKTAEENMQPEFLDATRKLKENEGDALTEANELENSPEAPRGFYRPENNDKSQKNNKSQNRRAGGSRVKGKIGSISAISVIVLIIVVIGVVMLGGNILPAAIHERIPEETDTQYADGQMSKAIILQQTFKEGYVASNFAENLKSELYIVGYEGDDAEEENVDGFVETNKHPQADEDCAKEIGVYCAKLSIKHGEEIIQPEDILDRYQNDTSFYKAINDATYGRAAYYYDDAAKDVFKKLGLVVDDDGVIALADESDSYDVVWGSMGVSGNDFTGDDTDTEAFKKKMDSLMGKGSGMSASTGSVETDDEDDDGVIDVINTVTSGNASISQGAAGFVNQIAENNKAGDQNTATLNSVDQLKDAEQVTRQFRSAQLYALMQQPTSKMKAGDGTESPIHPAMEVYFKRETARTVDENGNTVEIYGSPLESPSMMSVLAGKQVNNDDVKGYNMERINHLAGEETAVERTLISTDKGTDGNLTVFEPYKKEAPDPEVMNKAVPILEDSMENNSFSDMKGVPLGEEIINGAVYFGTLTSKMSGGSAGGSAAVEAYMKANDKIVAMDNEVDRMTRSPLDITSKNTFLGSIVYNIAMVSIQNEGVRDLMSGVDTVMGVVGKSIMSLLPAGMADDNSTIDYLTGYGKCQDEEHIGAVASPNCVEVMTFETSTWVPYDNQELQAQMASDTDYNEATNTRTVKDGTETANYMKYGPMRNTPVGTMDGSILDELRNGQGPGLFELLFRILTGMWPDSETGRIEVNPNSEIAQELMQTDQGEAILASFNNIEQEKLAQLAKVNWNNVDQDTFRRLMEKDYDDISELDQGTLMELAKLDWDIFGIFSAIANIWDMIIGWLWATFINPDALDWASNKEFVNTGGGVVGANGEYQGGFKYRWAQRYMALARAKDMLMSHTSDKMAYQNLKYLEGDQSPIAMYMEKVRAERNGEKDDATLAAQDILEYAKTLAMNGE